MKRERESAVGPPRPAAAAVTAGPAGPAQPEKKKKVLEFQDLYLAALPNQPRYELSFMHAEHVSHVAVAQATAFVVTASTDGRVKFWKKKSEGVEFVKSFRAHMAAVSCLAVSPDGRSLASCGIDGSVAVFDVVAFDMVFLGRLPAPATAVAWFAPQPHPRPVFAAGDAAGRVHLTDVESQTTTTLAVHGALVTGIVFLPALGALLSCDARGMLECWRPGAAPGTVELPPAAAFKTKSETDLYALCRQKVCALAAAATADGARVALYCSDSRIRIFKSRSMRLQTVYDEAPAAQTLPEGAAADPLETGRRAALHAELIKDAAADIGRGTAIRHPPQLCWDQSGSLLLFGSLFGIKVVNVVSSKVVRVLGAQESDRFAGLALYQGRVGANLDLGEAAQHAPAAADPILFAAPYSVAKQRFFLFSRRAPAEQDPEDPSSGGRDVLNERPAGAEDPAVAAAAAAARQKKIPQIAVMHTTAGDMRIRLFPQLTPRTYENFAGLASSGFYEQLIFHRVIRGFMIQTGDPKGDGTGGQSLWGGEFEDEFHSELRHDRPGVVSMANTGRPGTNASQFFITTAPIARLDGKHTVFGRVESGMEAVMAIERCDTDRDDRPLQPPRILSIELLAE